MMFLMGTVYQSLGLYAKARSLLKQTLEIDRLTFGSANEHTIATTSALDSVLASQGEHVEAEKWRVSGWIRRRVSMVRAVRGL
jgi:hypothetical protein